MPLLALKDLINLEIRSLHIDFDKNILEINGKQSNKTTIVALPSLDGWSIQKMFGEPLSKEKCNCLKVDYF